ncbi:unnamed protein product, partial [Scytosiphon promiscuus]
PAVRRCHGGSSSIESWELPPFGRKSRVHGIGCCVGVELSRWECLGFRTSSVFVSARPGGTPAVVRVASRDGGCVVTISRRLHRWQWWRQRHSPQIVAWRRSYDHG